MKLIISEAQIRMLMPNTIQFTKSEQTPLTKLAPFIDTAEQWLATNFTSDAVMKLICDERTDGATRKAACRAALAEALINAIPSLDVVMTANGFAVTATQNLTPASRPRVDALINSMVKMRDDALDELLHRLPLIAEWRHTEQAAWFGATLFPDFDITLNADVSSGSRWEHYQQLRIQLLAIESELAYSWVSPELMSELRSKNLNGSLTEMQMRVVDMLKIVECAVLRGQPINHRLMGDVVNIIRMQPSDFKLWHDSDTARLFEPPVFHNDKNSSGYFF